MIIIFLESPSLPNASCLESHYYVAYWINFFIMAWWAIFSQTYQYFGPILIVIEVVGNFNFSYFLRLTWEFLRLQIKRGGSVCWPNNKISQYTVRLQLFYFFQRGLWCANIFLKLVWNFFINVCARRKNELKIMILIFKNLLTYPTLVVWNLIIMLNIGLIFLQQHGGLYLVRHKSILSQFLL